MSLLPLGLLSQGGGGAAADAFELISTTVLGSASSSVTLSSIPATYKSLQLRIVARSSNGTQFDQLFLRLNADTGANYGSKGILMDTFTPTQVSATSQTGIRIYGIAANSASANNFSAVKMDITGYQDTNKKTSVRGFGGSVDFVASWQGNASVFSGIWNATTTVTSLNVSTYNGANLQIGSRISLYGVL
jgi:hypothetical protein